MAYSSNEFRMTNRKPRLFITPGAVAIRRFTEDYLDSLRDRFEIRTSSKRFVTREFLALCKAQDAIVAVANDIIDEDVVKAASGSLKMVSVTSAGYDPVDTNVMKAHGIRVGLAGSAVTIATAELAVALLLCMSRRLISAPQLYKSDPTLFFKRDLFGPSAGLEDSVIGIIGAGRIGQSVAQRVKVFQVKRLLYHSRTEKDEMKALDGQLRTLDNIFEESDYMIVTLAYNAETEKIVSRRLMNLMKPNAVLVNVGRGEEREIHSCAESWWYNRELKNHVTSSSSRFEVLTVGQVLAYRDSTTNAVNRSRCSRGNLAGAALDVTTPEPLPPDHPLLHLENALISPHLGFHTSPVERRSRDLAVRNTIAFFDNDQMPEELIL